MPSLDLLLGPDVCLLCWVVYLALFLAHVSCLAIRTEVTSGPMRFDDAVKEVSKWVSCRR